MTPPLDPPEADVLGWAVESALDRIRRGEKPNAEEYAARYPQHAEEIREAFSALVMMEAMGGSTLDRTASVAPGPIPEPREPNVPPDDPTLSQVLGDYRLIRLIGRGGMGSVYEAEQVSLKRRVALKVLPSDVTNDPNRLARFGREARAAGRLHHTNIVPVFGIGQREGSHFYVMPLIRGLNLDEVIRELRRARPAKGSTRPPAGPHADPGAASPAVSDSDPNPDAPTLAALLVENRLEATLDVENEECSIPDLTNRAHESNDSLAVSSLGDLGPRYWDSVARIGLQVTEALEHAHGQGILHRDIKPSNLLLDLRGTVWVTDFGLAKATEDDGLSLSRDVVGTIRYMACERFDGRADARSDVYSLGLTLYEMVALRPAFSATNHAALLRMVTHSAPVSLARLEATVPADLATIVHKAIAREPEGRYQSAAAMADDLRRFLERRPVRARQTSPLEKLQLWCRRNPWLAASNIAAAVLTTTLAIVSTIAAWNYGIQNRRISDELDKVRKAEQAAKEQEREAHVAQARAGRFSRRSGQRFDSLEALAKAARIRRTPGLRDEAIACMALPDLKLEKSILFDRVPIPFDVAPLLDRYAVVDQSGEVVFYRTDDKREILRLKGPGAARALNFSPDGARLRVSYDGSNGRGVQRVWDLRDERHITGIDIDARYIPGYRPDLGFTPDGKQLFGGLPDDSIGTFDVATGRLVRKTKLVSGRRIWRPSPDGRQLAYDARNEGDSVGIYDFGQGVVTASYPAQAGVGSVAWRDDGRLLAVGGSDGSIQVWDTERKTLVSVLEGHRHSVSSMAFTHASGLLVSSAWDGTTRLWEPVRGRLLVTAVSSGDGLQVSADDHYVCHGTYGRGLSFLRLETAPECRVLHHGLLGNRMQRPTLGWVGSNDFSPDGCWLASGSFDGVRLWDTLSGGGVAHLDLGHAFSAKFSPDGRRLLTFGRAGLWLWPISPSDPATASALNIGPPRRLNLTGGYESARASWNGDGRLLIASDPVRLQGVIFDAEKAAEVARLGVHSNIRYSLLSPDGHWAVISDWAGPGARIWEVATCQLVKTLECDSNIAFSPDGRWLAVSDNQRSIRLWHVGSWLAGPVLERSNEDIFAFSHDSRLIASGSSEGVLLIDIATKRRIAALASPPEAPPGARSFSFSPDGGQLAVGTSDPSVLLWDLRLVRRQLAELGLDWEAPPIPESVADRTDLTAPPSLKIDYGPMTGHLEHYSENPGPLVERYTERIKQKPDDPESYHHRAHGFANLNRREEALADASRAIRLRPEDAHLYLLRAQLHARLPKKLEFAIDDLETALKLDPSEDQIRQLLAEYCNELAWTLATNSPSPSNLDRALKLSARSVDLFPGRQITLNTRGVVLCWAGHYAEAITVLEKSLEAGNDQFDGFDLFFLAQAHHRLGHRDVARRCLARAIEWVSRQSSLPAQDVKELATFRAEAEAVLAGPSGELPIDVFAP